MKVRVLYKGDMQAITLDSVTGVRWITSEVFEVTNDEFTTYVHILNTLWINVDNELIP